MAEATVEHPVTGSPLRSKWRVGIVGHLALSFAAVGILAALANIIVERGVPIIEITRVTPVPIAAPIAVRLEEPAPVAAPIVASPDERRAEATEAVDRYGQAAIVRAQIANGENDERFRAAEANLVAQLAALAPSLDEKTERALEDAVDAYRSSGATLLSVADQRRQSVGRYAERLEALRGLLDQSVDKSWRIFGRVVARQTVLRLRTDHDRLQNAFTALGAASAFDPNAVTAVIEMEQAFDATLAENERGLVRSEGREWLDSVRSEFHQLIALRAALVIDWQRLEAVQLDFLQAGTRARERADAIPDLVEPVVTRAEPRRPFVGPKLEDVEFVGPPLLDSVAPSIASEPQIRVARQETNDAQRYVVAWARWDPLESTCRHASLSIL